MVTIDDSRNPFTVTSPEDMSSEDTFNLFVDVFSDFPKILDVGHTFLHGPRGSGKSMMFRYLMPDCQKICHNSIEKLKFYGIYSRIKNTELKITELKRLEGKHASFILNEHFMTIHFSEIVFNALLQEGSIEDDNPQNIEAVNLLFERFLMLLENCGWERKEDYQCFQSVRECFGAMLAISVKLYSEVKYYFRKLAFHTEIIPYESALCSYLDFLLPLLKEIKNLPFLPDGPIFLLLDDADNLSETQTRILNSWVFTRSSSDVSLKISTQLNYKTYMTVTGDCIETPHDYSEVNISTVYTASNKDNYKNRVREIVRKRLDKLSNINSDPDAYFEHYKKQEDAIKIIAEDIKERWNDGKGRGHRASDDVVRYARADYIKQLAGTSKSSGTYSYSGFNQLVSISSGIVRYFLDAAKDMFNEEKAKSNKNITCISASTQNKIVRSKAEEFLFNELAKKKDDQAITEDDEQIQKLFNLIQGLGGLFRACLMSGRSERKVFSFAFSNQPSNDVREILELGVRHGYFHKSTIGKKDSVSSGKTRLYILSRRLAPLYNLDPTGFAGYLFMNSDFVAEAMEKPDTMLRRVRNADDIETILQPKQLRLF